MDATATQGHHADQTNLGGLAGTVTRTAWIDVETSKAEELLSQSKRAEAQGDFATAASKGQEALEVYLACSKRFNSSDEERRDIMAGLIASTLELVNGLNARKEAAASQQAAGTSSPPNQRKWHILKEIQTTEERYLSRLRSTKKVYWDPLERELQFIGPVLSREEIAQIFGNLNEITQHSEALDGGLRRSLAHLSEGPAAQAPTGREGVASILRDSLGQMKEYERYVLQYEKANKLLLSLKADRPLLKTRLQQLELGGRSALPGDSVMSLDSYLIEPFQRVFRYEMLLKNALSPECQWTDNEREDLEQALRNVSLVADKMNREKLRREREDNLRRIERVLKGNKAPLPSGGVRHQGCLSLVKCGKSGYAAGKQWAYVFDDGFFCCEAAPTAAEQQGMFSPAEVGGAFPPVIAGMARKSAHGEGDLAIVLEVEGWGKCEFEAASIEEAKAWVSEVALGRLRDAALEEERNRIFRRHCARDGTLRKDQTLAALRAIDASITDQEAFSMFDSLDTDHVGRISLNDLSNAFKKMVRGAPAAPVAAPVAPVAAPVAPVAAPAAPVAAAVPVSPTAPAAGPGVAPPNPPQASSGWWGCACS